MIDEEEEELLRRQDEIDKEQAILLEKCYELYDTFNNHRNAMNIINPVPREEAIKCAEEYHAFDIVFKQLNIEHKCKFCIMKIRFNITIEEAMAKWPIAADFHIIYWLMYTSGWPEEVTAYKFKKVIEKEKLKIENLKKQEEYLRTANPLTEPNLKQLTEEHLTQCVSLIEEHFAPCLKRSRDEMEEDSNDFDEDGNYEEEKNQRSDHAITVARELMDLDKKKQKVFHELSQVVPVVESLVMENEGVEKIDV